VRPIRFIAILALAVLGCEKQPARNSFIQGTTPSLVNSAQINLVPSMTDGQILYALGLGPRSLKSVMETGKDGFTTIYSSEINQVAITRSIVSGVFVARIRPAELRQEWQLGKP
jgi:hypothetical protein